MMLRNLTKNEISILSNRHGVEGRAVEEFLVKVGVISIGTAYERLNCERKLNRWHLQTVSAISDGIVLATAKGKNRRESNPLSKGLVNPTLFLSNLPFH